MNFARFCARLIRLFDSARKSYYDARNFGIFGSGGRQPVESTFEVDPSRFELAPDNERTFYCRFLGKGCRQTVELAPARACSVLFFFESAMYGHDRTS